MDAPEGTMHTPERPAGHAPAPTAGNSGVEGSGSRVGGSGAVPAYPAARPGPPSGPAQQGPPLLVAMLALGGALVAVALLLGHLAGPTSVTAPAGAAIASPAEPAIGQPASPALVRMVTGIPQAVLAAVGPGHDASGAVRIDPLAAVAGPPLVAGGGKPQMLYIGGEFCPYCAAERWSLLNALSRFGTFAGLRYMRSADDDGDVATFTFARSTYRSPYLDFVMREASDRKSKDLQPLTDQQLLLDFTLGHGGVPFIDINGRYILNSDPAGYPTTSDAEALMGLDWAQIAHTLQNPDDPITGGIIGNANYLTAAICRQTADRPASACLTPTIRRLEVQLPTKPAARRG